MVGHGPKCILVGLANQSYRRIFSLLISEGINRRTKSRVYLLLFQDVQYFLAIAQECPLWKIICI